jgi:GntR family transcriptional repressor for pyruvate dehydrogenase complex
MEQKYSPVVIDKPSDQIIHQIKNLIEEGELKPGDRLPPERQLAESFKVSRNYVREAIKQLELYGILITKPQSGTTVSSLGIKSLEGLIKTAIGNKQEFADLMEVRRLLEVQSARQAALRAAPDQLVEIERCHDIFTSEALRGEGAVEEDLAFHLAIADASGNRVLRTFLGIIAPDIMRSSREGNSWTMGRIERSLEEHKAVLAGIKSGHAQQAGQAMKNHMKGTLKNFQNKGIL